MTAIIVVCVGAACLVAAGFLVSPTLGLAVVGLFALAAGLLVEFGDDT